MSIKFRLIVLNLLQYAIWGAYLTTMGRYLSTHNMAPYIGHFYSVQGFVALFMPALMGMVADRWMQAQRVLGLCHLFSSIFMAMFFAYAYRMGNEVEFFPLFLLFSLSTAFYMPTVSLSNSVAYHALSLFGLEPVKAFPPIRFWGTIGFIISMWIVDLGGMQASSLQFGVSALCSVVLGTYALTLPSCQLVRERSAEKQSWIQAMGFHAFRLFRNGQMGIFFLFSILVGVCLHITNAYANPFIHAFSSIPEYQHTFGVQHANILISLSQLSETFCILLIPFCLRKFGIKQVILIAILAWALRFLFFAIGNPGDGLWLFVLSMFIYGIAFDFFHISGSLYVNQVTDAKMQNSAQGLFMMMNKGLGATLGMQVAQWVVNKYVYALPSDASGLLKVSAWHTCWYIFAAYALCVAVAFWIAFKYTHNRNMS